MLQVSPATQVSALTIRSYRPTDHRECRLLWAEMTAADAGLYGVTSEDDSGAAFEEYLTRLDLSVDAWVVNGGASDHLPVVAHLEATRRF